MTGKQNRNSREVTRRVYDKASGEYRPVFQKDAANNTRRDSKYATPQRRAEMRKRRRRRALLIFYLFLFVTVITGAITLSLTVLFKIDSIQIEGTSRYPAQEIIGAGGIKKGDNLFLAKTKEAEEKIQQTLPYIGTVAVSRRLPAQIVIKVSEKPVSGAVEYNKKYAIVSTEGKVLELVASIPTSCPVIKGLKVTKAEVGKSIVYQDAAQQTMFKDLTTAISVNHFQKITSIDLSDPYKIRAVYDNRVILNLGLPSDFDYKLRFAKSILDAGKIKETEKGTLNLSVAVEENNAYFDPDYSASSSAAGSTK